MLAGTGCFNRGVQGQQVGLVSYAHDSLYDIANVRCLLLKLRDFYNRCGLAIGSFTDVSDQAVDFLTGF